MGLSPNDDRVAASQTPPHLVEPTDRNEPSTKLVEIGAAIGRSAQRCAERATWIAKVASASASLGSEVVRQQAEKG
jgi:hypothetical protein